MSERETVWCEAHGGLTNPHFEQDDCIYPHFTDPKTRARMNADPYGEAERTRLTGKVNRLYALADRYAADGYGQLLKSDAADTIRALLAD